MWHVCIVATTALSSLTTDVCTDRPDLRWYAGSTSLDDFLWKGNIKLNEWVWAYFFLSVFSFLQYFTIINNENITAFFLSFSWLYCFSPATYEFKVTFSFSFKFFTSVWETSCLLFTCVNNDLPRILMTRYWLPVYKCRNTHIVAWIILDLLPSMCNYLHLTYIVTALPYINLNRCLNDVH